MSAAMATNASLISLADKKSARGGSGRPAMSAAGGFKVRMRAWFAAIVAIGRYAVENRVATISVTAHEDRSNAGEGTIVLFPLSAHTRLSRLAHDMKQRFVALGFESEADPLPYVTSGAAPRLWIDSAAHIEVQVGRHGYRAVLDNVFGTRLTLESDDAETIVQFVCHYMIARRAETGEAVGQ
jgi:hypothetical protein